MSTKIQWTEATWNPVAGCSIVSPGCHNCYAMTMAARLEAMWQAKYQGLTKKLNGRALWTGKVHCDEAALSIPLKRKKPTMYFVNSMSDLFHEDVPDEFIDKVFAVMSFGERHTFQVLTKRAERMKGYMASREKSATYWKDAALSLGFALEFQGISLVKFPPPNVWLGVSVEDQKRADERIPRLQETTAAVRFLSCEPLLELIAPDLEYIHWVIVGGESGQNARPCKMVWIRSVIEQCRDFKIPCFVKQLGSKPEEWDAKYRTPGCGPYIGNTMRDSKGGDMSEWPYDLRVREFPK